MAAALCLWKLIYVVVIGCLCFIPLAAVSNCGIPGGRCQYPGQNNKIRILKEGRDEGKLWGKSEDEKALYLRLECPGIDQQHFNITYQGNGYLLMMGVGVGDADEDEVMYSGVLHLSPAKFDFDSITSNVKDGVAYVVIPKNN